MRRAVVVLLGSLLAGAVAACTTGPVITPVPTTGPCGAADINLVAGQAGAALGSAVLNIEVHLVGAKPCFINAWPEVEILSGAGGSLVSAPAVPNQALLEDERDFHLFWASNCGGLAPGPYTVHLQLGTGASSGLRLPDGFGPSGCNGAPMQVGIEPAWDE